MTLLDRLTEVLQLEHRALVAGDWRALEVCVSEKHELAHQLTLMQFDKSYQPRLSEVRARIKYNSDLAQNLSQHVSALLSRNQRGTTYNGVGRVPQTRHALLNVRG